VTSVLPLAVIAGLTRYLLNGKGIHFGTYCIDKTVYHLGASLKDLGKKWFAFSRMEVGTDGLLGKL
jgi:hypothetical protein